MKIFKREDYSSELELYKAKAKYLEAELKQRTIELKQRTISLAASGTCLLIMFYQVYKITS